MIRKTPAVLLSSESILIQVGPASRQEISENPN
jgi:hypothetical protein